MVDPTSDIGEDVTAEDAPRCATCGDPIVRSVDHRVITWIDEDEVQVRHFCGPDCLAAWES